MDKEEKKAKIIEEKKKILDFILDHQQILHNFLTPISFIDKMPSFGAKNNVANEIRKQSKSLEKQVEIFLTELENSDEPGTLQSFLDALKTTDDHKWIHSLVTGKLSDKDLEKFIYHIKNIDKIKSLINIILPQFKDMSARDLLDEIGPKFLSKEERDLLMAQYFNDGNTPTIFWIFYFFLRKSPKWFKELYRHVKDKGYGDGVSGITSLAEALNTYVDFGPESDDEDDIEVDAHKDFWKPQSSMSVGGGATDAGVVSTSYCYVEEKMECDNADDAGEFNIPLPAEKSTHKVQPTNASCISPAIPNPPVTNSHFRIGDKVRVSLEPNILKALQEKHGGWNDDMTQLINIPGSVYRVTVNGDVKVRYDKSVLPGLRRSKQHIYTFNFAALEKIC